ALGRLRVTGVAGLLFDARVTGALCARDGAASAQGCGSVHYEDGTHVMANHGAILCAAVHPSGDGVVAGGDDGAVIWARREDPVRLTQLKGRWIDAIAASPASGLIAFAAGRTVTVLDGADPHFRRTFEHERPVAGLAFDAKGRRLACATYGGAALWFARIEAQKPTLLKWAGSHTAVAFSPDARFVVTAMQDNQLHGWRLSDGNNMRMGGYPAKIRTLAFLSGGALLATSGAQGAVLWPFTGSNGPMGREATEIGYDESALVLRIAAATAHGRLAAGLDDGRVWAADPAGRGLDFLKAEKGAAISALAMSADARRVAWADEDGQAGVVDLTL